MEPMLIIDGLPPGTTMELDDSLYSYSSIVRTPGGSLGGEIQSFDASLRLRVSGTGTLAGFNRTLVVPVHLDIHTGPRTPGDPIQSFPTALYLLAGELFGDPDFCEFRISAGTEMGLPSPGQETLTDLGGGTFAVESFFDVTYQIEFEGCPGSQLEGYAGRTTATIRIYQGEPKTWNPGDDHKMHFPQLPDLSGWAVNATWMPIGLGPTVTLADDWLCSETGWVKDIHFWGSYWFDIFLPIDTFTLSIHSDVPAGVDLQYSHPGELLWERRITALNVSQFLALGEGWHDPSTNLWDASNHNLYYQYDVYLDSIDWFWQEEGTVYWLDINARINNNETVRWGWKSTLDHWNDDGTWIAEPEDWCVEPDNGSGTVDLPADCIYYSPEETMLIIDGLPPGTTIELDPILQDYFNINRQPGGTLGGEILNFDATLSLTVHGTGILAGFNRSLAVPVSLEVHTGPRTPGDPVQTFPTALYSLTGQLFGDPDFCEFLISGGIAFGLPSLGQMTLTDLGDGTYHVESFFDITYQIQFEGCPGSQLEDYSGVTTATIRMQHPTEEPPVWQELREPTGQSMDLSFVITGTCCDSFRGDANGDGDDANILDLTFVVDWIFRGSGDPGPCQDESDANSDGDPTSPNILDLTYLVDNIFRGGPDPGPCP
jgi:hypothetical protein